MIKAPEDRYQIALLPGWPNPGYTIFHCLNDDLADAVDLYPTRAFSLEAAKAELARLVEEDYAEQAARDKWENDR